MISPNSSLLSSIYIPDYFSPMYVSTINNSFKYEKDFTFEFDNTGLKSIIKLNVVPFIDLSKYNFNRKSWYGVDCFDGIWEIIEPYEYNPDNNEVNNSQNTIVKSVEGYYNNTYININDVDKIIKPSKYYPINIKLNNNLLKDQTDYSNIINIPVLNFINNDLIKEFYYDFNNIIYTNQNLELYDINNIEIGLYLNITDIRVKCIMSSNSIGLSNTTPIVDHYLLKLSGQDI